VGGAWGEVQYSLDSPTAKTVAIATKVAVEGWMMPFSSIVLKGIM